jgi:hypothetical protein
MVFLKKYFENNQTPTIFNRSHLRTLKYPTKSIKMQNINGDMRPGADWPIGHSGMPRGAAALGHRKKKEKRAAGRRFFF